MHADLPPHSLRSLAFPFPALAALAGRLPLGGGREIALASLTAARLAGAMLQPDPLPVPDRVTRASAARVWLASLALPPTLRAPFTRCFESTGGAPMDAAGTIRSLLAVISGNIDGPSNQELERLAQRLSSSGE